MNCSLIIPLNTSLWNPKAHPVGIFPCFPLSLLDGAVPRSMDCSLLFIGGLGMGEGVLEHFYPEIGK